MRWLDAIFRRPGKRPPSHPIPDQPQAESCPADSPTFQSLKSRKLDAIAACLLPHESQSPDGHLYNCLPQELRDKYNIVDTTRVSANEYDPIALDLINKHAGGLVLDCGAGLRGRYYVNVVNFEIVAYPTTDVLGVGEELPFRDESFDAVLSLNVLEHVKDPFLCASQISRVLKPGGSLYCVVPFLQPLHGYPHHYYNMSHQGLRNLFSSQLEIQDQQVIGSGLPIWTLNWMLRSWADGLSGDTRRRFLGMRVEELMADPIALLGSDFVTGLSAEKNFELASTTALLARKALR